MTVHAGQNITPIEVYTNGQVVTLLAASMTALVVYDILLFLPVEFKFVWMSQWTFGKLLYLGVRYGTLAVAIAGFFGSVYVDSRISVCRVLTQLFTAGACALSLGLKALQLLRATAVLGGSIKMRQAVGIFSVIQIITLFGLSIKFVLSYEPIEYPFQEVSCALLATFPRPIYITFYALSVIPEVVILGICAIRLIYLYSDGKFTLVWVIFRDIVFFMLEVTLLVIPHFLTPLFVPETGVIIVAGMNFAILSISGISTCQMILNMRSCVRGADVSLSKMATACPSAATISQMRFESGQDNPDTEAWEVDSESWELDQRVGNGVSSAENA